MFVEEYIKELFEEYLLKIHCCGEENKINDAKIISELIILKYGGTDMTDVLTEVLKLIHERNHYLAETITIN